MTIGIAATITSATHEALLNYREYMRGLNYKATLPEEAGNLIAEALQANGFLNRPEHARDPEARKHARLQAGEL